MTHVQEFFNLRDGEEGGGGGVGGLLSSYPVFR